MKKNTSLKETSTYDNTCKNFFSVFEQHAIDHPQKPVIIEQNKLVTYHSLLTEVKKTILALRGIGIKSGDHIIVALQPSVELVKIFLSSVGVGATYVPIDPSFPKGRLEFIINEINPVLVITEKKYKNKFPIDFREILLVDEIKLNDITYQELENVGALISNNNIAYTIYTSGSTGTPKGVRITYAGLANVLKAVKNTIDFSVNDTMLFFSKPWFDIAYVEFLLPLLNGATLAIPPQEFFFDGKKLASFLKKTSVSVMQTTPSVWNILFESNFITIKHIKAITTGEELTQDLRKKLLDRFKNVWNFYGPTECTIYSTACKVRSSENITIGSPLENVIIKVLSSQKNEVEIGDEGELYIGGLGVSPGYHQSPELNSSKFLNIIEKNGIQMTFYKSGDLGKYLPDGNLAYLGRKDSQMKFRGLRIDLQEITHVIQQSSFVKEAVVYPQHLNSTKAKLVAYVSLKDKNNTRLKEMYREIEILRWKQIYDGVYDEEKIGIKGIFNTAGWRDSYHGKLIDSLEIEEIVDTTVNRINTYNPQRILEIGCGTGLLLFKLIRQCKEYVGTDISKNGLDFVRKKLEQENIKNVSLLNQEATNMEGIEGTFDFIIINSVVHHFPDVDYLKEVLKKLETFLSKNGILFVGDIRNKELLMHYHLSVMRQKVYEGILLEELLTQINASASRENQLLLSTSFFRDYFSASDTFCHLEIWPKTAKLTNEITKFRYDVILSKKQVQQKEVHWNEWSAKNWSYPQIQANLKKGTKPILALRRMPNPKIFYENQLLKKASSHSNLKKQLCEIKIELTHGMQMLSLDNLQKLAQQHGYEFEASCLNTALDGSYDVVFSKKETAQGRAMFLDTSAPAAVGKSISLFKQKEKDNIILELYDLCADALPEHMIPSDFIIVDSLPISSSGKLDIQRLPKLPHYSRSIKDEYVKPNSKTEKALVAIWEQVLSVDHIGIEDNFFRLGGDSILCMLMIRRANEKNIPIDFQMVFSHPTIKQLAQRIGYEHKKVPPNSPLKIQSLKSSPLTPAQMLVLNSMQSNKNFYCQHVLLKCNKKYITESVTKEAIKALIKEHDALRNAFSSTSDTSNGTYLEQICRDEINYVYLKKDFSKLPLSQIPNALQKNALDLFQSINIEKGLVVGIGYFDCGQEGLRILLAIHSLVADNISVKIICEKFEKYCHYLIDSKDFSIEENNFSFKEWCAYLKQYKNELISEVELQYWKDIDHKIDKRIPSFKEEMDIHGFKEGFKKEESAVILEKCKLHYLDLRSVLLTVLTYTLLKFNDFGDQNIEIESHGRHAENYKHDLSKVVGRFSTYFPFHLNVNSKQSFWKNAHEVKKKCDSVPLSGAHYQLIKTLRPDLLPEKNRPRISFNYLGIWQDNHFLLPQNKIKPIFSYAPERIKNTLYEQYENIAGLTINILNIQDNISLAFKYDQNIFSRDAVRQFANNFINNLKIVALPDEELTMQ